ncbi:MAG: ATP-binding cassette domain-containing protein [Candidatus Saccharibacteria bacterium]
MKQTSPLVAVDNFRMDFDKHSVIRQVSFSVNRGETFGLLGANGSGKTTIIRALLGIYRPTGGQLLINGAPYTVDGNVKLGYLPEERGLYKKETVMSVMVYFGRLKGMSASDASSWSTKFLERVGLSDKALVKIDKLSGGQQQKIQLGLTIMNDPELLILDEPTKGFDPINRRLLMTIIEEHQRAGATVIFVTHQMEEVERLCDRIILLKDGGVSAYGSVKQVKQLFQNDSLDDIFVKIYGDKSATGKA